MTEGEWKSVIDALHDIDNIDGAVAAAAELQKKSTVEDIPRLISLLDDDSFFVREAAAWPLSDLGCTQALPILLAAYQRGFDEGHDNDGFSAALIDLVAAHSVESRARLEALANESNENIRNNVQWLLGFCD